MVVISAAVTISQALACSGGLIWAGWGRALANNNKHSRSLHKIAFALLFGSLLVGGGVGSAKKGGDASCYIFFTQNRYLRHANDAGRGGLAKEGLDVVPYK